MAIIENRVSEEGDVLIIKPETPIVGLISLYQFVDTTTGESETDYFRKEFRYSVDGGLTFGEWTELLLINIQSVDISRYDQFVIEYRYTRVGETPAVDLTFEDILVSGEITSLPYPVFDDSVFKKFFEINNIYVYGWALNVLEKLYRKGLILPDYIDRADNNSNIEDEDFIVYWNSITHYFAVIVYFARQFENIESNSIMLEEFIKNKDLAFFEGNDFEDLLYIYQHYVDEYGKRGTVAILESKIRDEAPVDGELLRLINYKNGDPLTFTFLKNYNTGWCVGKSSPCYSNTNSTVAIGGFDFISPNEDYEVSFRITQTTPEPFFFAAAFFNLDEIEIIPINFNTGINSPFFIESEVLPLANVEYLIRGIIWNSSKVRDFTSTTNIFGGDNLQSTSDTVYASIYAEGASAATTVYDIKLTPLKLNFSRGQLGVHSILYMTYKNNNGSLSDEKIKKRIASELVSYDTFIKTKQL